MTRKRTFLAGALLGATLQYFTDPLRGRRRRRTALERATATLRRSARHAHGVAQQAAGRARGALHRLRPARPHPLDDVELAHKVESVLGRDRDVPKGRVSVNAENGTVYLRGQLDDEWLIERIAAAVRKIPEVDRVVNLLHLPGTAAPHA